MTILNFETKESPESTRVALRGELDLSTAARVERELRRVEEAGAAEVVLDLSGLTFLDSTGLRIIVGADGRARAADRRFVVVKGPPHVHRVFSITKLDERLEMVDDAGDPAAS